MTLQYGFTRMYRFAFWRSPHTKLCAVNVKDAKECGRVHHKDYHHLWKQILLITNQTVNTCTGNNEKRLEELTEDMAFIKDTL